MLVISLAAVSAEEGPSVPETRVPTFRKAKFVCTAQVQELKNPVRVATTQESTVISVSKRVLSEPVKLPEDGQLRLLALGKNPENPDDQNDRVLVQTVVPLGVKEPLIILSPIVGKTDAPPVSELKATVQDLSPLAPGDWIFINVSTKSVGIVLDEEKSSIKPGDSHIHKTRFSPSGSAKQAEYQIFSIDEEKWALLASSTVMLNPSRMEMCIFSDDPNSARVTYHGITLFGEAADPEEIPPVEKETDL